MFLNLVYYKRHPSVCVYVHLPVLAVTLKFRQIVKKLIYIIEVYHEIQSIEGERYSDYVSFTGTLERILLYYGLWGSIV